MMENKEKTNWKYWYIALIAVLVIQIVVYLIITKSYEL